MSRFVHKAILVFGNELVERLVPRHFPDFQSLVWHYIESHVSHSTPVTVLCYEEHERDSRCALVKADRDIPDLTWPVSEAMEIPRRIVTSDMLRLRRLEEEENENRSVSYRQAARDAMAAMLSRKKSRRGS